MGPPFSSALVAFGGNLGDTDRCYSACQEQLRQTPGIQLVAVSSLVQTQPVGGPAGQANFSNGAIRLRTTQSAEELLATLQRIEANLGRSRGERWGPRTIDLDLLLFDQQLCHSATLTLPHPRMAFRRFVLEPACEVAAELVHPTTGWSLAQLRDNLRQTSRYVAICGASPTANRKLLAELAELEPLRPLYRDRLAGESADPAKVLADLKQIDSSAWIASDLWTISDFSIEEFSSWAQSFLAGQEREDFLRTLATIGRGLVSPQLNIFLDVPEFPDMPEFPGVVDSRGERGEFSSQGRSAERQFAAALRLRMAQPNHGPVLHLNVGDWTTIVTEAAVVLRAMKG